MKLKELIRLAKQCSYDYENIELDELLSKHDSYYVEIASGSIINEYGNERGYIEYSTKLPIFPKIGEVILMHDKFVGRVKKITHDSHSYDAEIWIDTAYHIDAPNIDNELKYPTFNAGTQIKHEIHL